MSKRNPPFRADHAGSLLRPRVCSRPAGLSRAVRYQQNNYGFSSTVHGNEITEAEQWAKLELVVNPVRGIWGVN